MAMDVGSSGGPRSDINITPLIDVVLVLLIIFMVLTPSMLKHLTATVPKKADDSSASASSDTTIVVEYNAKREVKVNTEPVPVSGLGNTLKQRLKGTRQKVVFFKPDDDAPYGEVVWLMDIARGVGATNLAVVTQ